MSGHLGEKRTFYISSESNNAGFVSGTASDFTFKLDIPQPNNFDSVCVLQCSIPKTYYQITADTGNFTLTENTDATISLDPGFYSKRSLSTILATKLNAGSPNGWTYTITYPDPITTADTQKYTFTVAGNGGVQPSLTFGSKTEFAHELMGFNAETTYAFVGDSLTSANVLNFQPTTGILIKSDLINNHDGVLQEVFAGNDQFMTDIRYQTTSIEFNSKPISTNKSNVYRFTLVDTEGNPIDTNGNSIHMSICFYQRNDHPEHSRRAIALSVLDSI